MFFRESGKETCNFRQFVKTLAHFRPIDSSKENPLNTREKKLKCKFVCIMILNFCCVNFGLNQPTSNG